MFHVKRPAVGAMSAVSPLCPCVSADFVSGYVALLLGADDLVGPIQRHQAAARLLGPALRLVSSLGPPHGCPVAELGAGVGPFAVVAAGAWRWTEVSAIDRRARCAAFLEAAGAILDLPSLHAVCVDVPPHAPPEALRGRFHLVVVRAIADVATSFALASGLVAAGGSMILHHTTPECPSPVQHLRRGRRWNLSDHLQRLYATEFADGSCGW